MAVKQLNKYIWLLELIHKKKRISLREINRYWVDNDMSGGHEIPERTFHKWRCSIEDIFGIVIENEKCGDYRYYILNDEALSQDGLRKWLFNTISVSNLILSNHNINQRILLEDIPSGQHFLPLILEAMQGNVMVEFNYQSFWKDMVNNFKLQPYCVKLFKQRWYLVGRNVINNRIMIFALDRILDFHVLADRTFIFPENFSPESYFEGCYGVIVGDETKQERIRLKVSGNQAKFFRSLPLHSSQKETDRNNEYSVFEYDLRPTFDFQQEILSHTPNVEVLTPLWLRHQIAWKIDMMNRIYNGI